MIMQLLITDSFNFKVKVTGQTENVEIMVPL